MHEGILSESGWPMVELSSACELISRGTAPNYDEGGSVFAIGQRCVQPGGFSAAFLKRHRNQGGREVIPVPGDVLLNSTGTGTIGRSCLFWETGSYIADGHITVMRPGADLDGRWLNLLLRSYWGQQYLESHCFVGSTGQVELSRSELLKTKIPLPPLVEQRRIAEVADEVDTQDSFLRGLQVKTQIWFRGLRRSLLSDNDDWVTVTVGELGNVVTGRTPAVDVPSGRSSCVPFVTPSEIGEDGHVGASIREARRGTDGVVEIPAGATLVVCIGFGVGKVGFLGYDACVNQQINAVIPIDGVDPYFVFNLLSEISGQIKSGASLQVTPIINKSEFSAIPVRIPDYQRQTEISEVLKRADRAMANLAVQRQKLAKLKQAIMCELLDGETASHLRSLGTNSRFAVN